MKKVKIELELTEEQAELLVEALESYLDEGPSHEGWQSNELSELSSLISTKVDNILKC